ncbi:MAG: hypothetical protein M3N24_03080 [Actinomycetota bacterium]|nr:hypothetical protein [Actinomycetota bacterium]
MNQSIIDASVNPADAFIARIQYVAMRLEDHSRRAVPGLTDPDPKTGEQWEWGQVWAHLGEFIPYWMDQARRVIRWPGSEPIPFGRIKTDAERVAAIERDRRIPPSELMERLKGHLADLWEFVDQVPSGGWSKSGVHQTLGMMDVRQIVEEFLVGHLEEHEAQLRQLVDRESKPKNGE